MPKTKLTDSELNSWPLWKLLRLARRDLRRFERTAGCVVDMSCWLTRRGRKCVGCMAGSVLREEFGRRSARCGHVPKWTAAVNALRTGCVGSALDHLSRNWQRRPFDDHPLDRYVADYHEDRPQFYRDMLALERDLKAAGL